MLPPDADPDFAGPYCLEDKAPVGLWPKETIAWMGRPVPSMLAMQEVARSFILILGGVALLSLAWKDVAMAVAAFAEGRAVAVKTLLGFVVAVAMAGLIALEIASPFLAWRRAGRTTYLLTTRRALVLLAGRRLPKVVLEYELEDLILSFRVERQGGAGDLVFERRTVGGKTEAVGFLGIEDILGVERLLRRLIAAAPATSPASPKGIAASLSGWGKGSPEVGGFQPVSSYPLGTNALFGRAAVMFVSAVMAMVSVAMVPVAGPGSLVMTGMGTAMFVSMCRSPIEFAICDDHTLSVRRWFLSGCESIPIRSIRSIRRRGVPPYGGEQFLLTHDRGRVWCSVRIQDIRDLLATLKFLNPAIEVEE